MQNPGILQVLQNTVAKSDDIFFLNFGRWHYTNCYGLQDAPYRQSLNELGALYQVRIRMCYMCHFEEHQDPVPSHDLQDNLTLAHFHTPLLLLPVAPPPSLLLLLTSNLPYAGSLLRLYAEDQGAVPSHDLQDNLS
jgi:hypothetical protein